MRLAVSRVAFFVCFGVCVGGCWFLFGFWFSLFLFFHSSVFHSQTVIYLIKQGCPDAAFASTTSPLQLTPLLVKRERERAGHVVELLGSDLRRKRANRVDQNKNEKQSKAIMRDKRVDQIKNENPKLECVKNESIKSKMKIQSCNLSV